MPHLPAPTRPSPSQAGAEPPESAAATRRLRRVHRAASELRRGVPVRLCGETPLVVIAAETAGPEGLADLAAWTAEIPVLLLAPTRAAAVLRRPVEQAAAAVALRLPAAARAPEVLRALADPMLDRPAQEPLESVALPPGAEAALALAKLARVLPAVLTAPARTDAAERPALLEVEATEILAYPADAATGLRQVAAAHVPLDSAPDARVVAFRTESAGTEHLAIIVGTPETQSAPLVRLHSECFTGDLLGSLRCDCGQQLRGALSRMTEEGGGVLLYLAQEGRGIGLVNKLRAYALQDRGLDTLDANRALGWDADERNFLVAATMLELLGLKRIRLLTNNPDKLSALAACGVEIVGREAHAFAPNGVNDEYLATKAARFGHLLD